MTTAANDPDSIISPATSFTDLPSDVFLLIFFFLVRRDTQPLKKLHIVGQVCRKLRGIVDEAPGLWTNVSLHDPRFLLEKAGPKSKQASLNIRIDERAFSERPTEFTERLDIIRPHLHRCVNLDLTLFPKSMAKVTSVLFVNPMPILRRLSVSSPGGTSTQAFVNGTLYVPIEAPVLECLILIGVPVPWDYATLTGIRLLRLRKVPNYPTSGQLLNLLKRNSTLQFLEIRLEPNVDVGGAGPSTEEELIVLPRLSCIQLAGFTPSLTTSLLAQVQAPVCRSFSFALQMPSVNNFDVRRALQHTLDFIPTGFQAEDTKLKLNLEIRQVYHMARLSTEDEEEGSFEVRWPESCASEGRQWFQSDLLSLINEPDLTVWFQPSAGNTEARRFLDDISPHVNGLDFSSREHLPLVVDTLSQRSADEFWFPNLTHLAFYLKPDMAAVLRMVRRRYGHPTPNFQVQGTLPQPFKRLKVGPKGASKKAAYDEWLDQLKGIVGNGVVVR